MIDHIMLMVKDKKISQIFYEALLAPLGSSLIHSSDQYAGFGQTSHVPFWLKQASAERVTQHTHVAFSSNSRKLVHQFYETALKLGAKPNGPPGPRPEHGPHYYAAYVYDLDGHNIEAVCYANEEA